MATYSNNTTIKINTKINLSVSSTYPQPTSTTSYTVPANSYLDFIGVANGSGTSGNGSISIDSVGVVSGSSSSGAGKELNLKAGPGAVVTLTASNGTNPGSSGAAAIHGVLFTNTP